MLLVIIVSAVASLVTAAVPLENKVTTKHLPHLAFNVRDSLFLWHHESWRPGQSTLVTALSADQVLLMHLDLLHLDIQDQPPKCTLLYKCSATDDAYLEASLTQNATGVSVTLCPQTRPFTIVSLTGNRYNLTLSQQNFIEFGQAMTHLLELRVRVEFTVGNSDSASLFVYNLDALAKLNNNSVSVSGASFTRYILSKKSESFFTKLSGSSTSANAVQKVKLLDDMFLKALKSASVLVRSVMYVSVIVRGNKLCTDKLENSSSDIIFTSGESEGAYLATLSARLTSFIDLDKGELIYSEHALKQQRQKLRSAYYGKPIWLCLRISLNAPIWNYRLLLTAANLNASFFEGSNFNYDKDVCEISQRHSAWKILTAGMRNVLLLSPIVCKDISTAVITVFFKEVECVNIIWGSHTAWQDCGGYQISNHGNAVLINVVEQRNAGSYRFHVTNYNFKYIISVISLPVFSTASENGSLQHITYANLDLKIAFNCTAFHDGMSYVSMSPRFRVLERFGDQNWLELDADQFALRILRRAPNVITVRGVISKSWEKATNLYVNMPFVTIEWRSWILIYSCRAQVDSRKANKFGLPSYVAETSTDVVYFGKPILQYKHSLTATASPVLICLLLSAPWFLQVQFCVRSP